MQVFILQVEGRKRWSLHEARAALPLSDMVRGKGRRPAAQISTRTSWGRPYLPSLCTLEICFMSRAAWCITPAPQQ